jgi:phosphorylcholine metabolism protein LicD
MLQAVASKMDRHNLTYWLTFGTLLGLVRDDKFIPWTIDNDIAILNGTLDMLYGDRIGDSIATL